MTTDELEKMTGYAICEFPPDADPCESCGESGKQLYFQGSDDGEGTYLCRECVVGLCKRDLRRALLKMSDIKQLTDTELVEAVAREVLGLSRNKNLTEYLERNPELMHKLWEQDGHWIEFNPFANANDLMMVLENFINYQITKLDNGYNVCIGEKGTWHEVDASTLPRAVLEAALMARIEK